MGGTGERRTGGRRAIGVVSLLLSVFSGVLFLLLVALARLNVATEPPLVNDTPGLGLLLILLVCVSLLAAVLSLVIAAAALLRPGRGWPLALAGWSVGACVLAYASSQSFLWTPFEVGGGSSSAESAQYEAPPVEGGMGWVEPEMVVEEPPPPMSEPPDAYLSSARRDAMGAEGTYCWAPAWAADCVEDAGIPLPPERGVVSLRLGETADLVFALRSSEELPAFAEGQPVIDGASAYPLEQETETVPVPNGERYLVPGGGSRGLKEERVQLRGGEERGVTKVSANVPPGEYVFQVRARPADGEESPWAGATYHFRVLVLPASDRPAPEGP